MKGRNVLQVLMVLGVGLPVVGLSGCCGQRKGNMKLHSLYVSTLTGAGVGWIVGHQSNEDGEGAAIGAGLTLTGTLLHYIDEQMKPGEEPEEPDKEQQKQPKEKAAAEQGLFLAPVNRSADAGKDSVQGVQLVFCRKF